MVLKQDKIYFFLNTIMHFLESDVLHGLIHEWDQSKNINAQTTLHFIFI